ncbi:hypothetical protein NDU88_009610 [Pleurodeles waltl]|uniref:Sulfotransferase n=1 Tax=Pleurodeles waltl TaxID=8319 RepID=A0AAV7PVF9_PLEWA|nr:hypothetical protein NDU88_009610 [Pleurodeles waltl]
MRFCNLRRIWGQGAWGSTDYNSHEPGRVIDAFRMHLVVARGRDTAFGVDLRGSVQKISTFVGKELDEKAIDAIVENASFKSMKENKMANFTLVPADLIDQKDGSFIRKGISGDWRNHFTDQQKEHFDKVYKEKMKDLSVKLIWD